MTPENQTSHGLNRRAFLASTAAAAMFVGTTLRGHAKGLIGADFPYEVTRTEAEWREMLSDVEYRILREGATEPEKVSPLWNEMRQGQYHCKGCDLHVFDGRWKVIVEDKGWAFFGQSVPNAILMGIDGPTPEYGDMTTGLLAVTEDHCRRCGSHLGHYLIVGDRLLHCINGLALTFKPAEA